MRRYVTKLPLTPFQRSAQQLLERHDEHVLEVVAGTGFASPKSVTLLASRIVTGKTIKCA